MKVIFKEKIELIKDRIKNVFKTYPITMILIYICTIIFTLLTNTDYIKEEFVQKIIECFAIWLFGTFFIENIKPSKIKKIVFYSITGVISILFTYVIEMTELSEKILFYYMATLGALSIYIIIKQSGKDIPEYLLKVTLNFIKVGFIYSILAIGIAIIILICNLLILKIEMEILSNIEILIFGMYFIPQMIYALSNVKEEVPDFFKKVIEYVLMPLVIITFAIIYIYMIKILILRQIPQNTIYRISLGLFLVGGFIWTVMQYFNNERIMYKISLKLPIIFSPFILLQIYAIGVRIAENSLTPARYICVVIIILEMCYILAYLLKRDKLIELIIVADALLIISLLIPGINMFDLSTSSQIKNLEMYNEKGEYTDKEKEKILGAYNYLRYDEKGRKYIEENFTKSDIESIKKLISNNNYNYRYSYKYVMLDNKEDINISGYNKMSQITASKYLNEKNINDTFHDVIFTNKNNNRNFKVNITIEIKDYILKQDNKCIEIQIDEERKMVIYSLSLRYDEYDNIVDNYYIEGYLLEK